MASLQKISVRVSDNLLKAVDDLIEAGGDDLRLFPSGAPSRSEMVRMCVARGIEVWQSVVRESEEEQDISSRDYWRDRQDGE